MSYEDKHGITDIKSGQLENVSVSRDTDLDWDTYVEYPVAVLLYTPDMKDTNQHFHIPFNVSEAKELVGWLEKFIKEHENV